ncbi:hypothetical protein M0805_007331 [Coniferiporia weirii]|nr:hypothetical protein M0805_007331 [Coniferiporia weirii]
MHEPAWRKTKLPLERPYKDDSGRPLPTLLDIAQDGEFIYEPRQEWDAKLGERFRRIFAERGLDFFTSDPASRYGRGGDEDASRGSADDEDVSVAAAEDQDSGGEPKLMTPEMLFKMRSEILPRLHIALGEMSHARDLLSLLLSASAPAPSIASASTLTTPSTLPLASLNPALVPGLLTASTVSALPPILSVQAFNAQLVTGGKDDALRKASDMLRVAAEGVERSTTRSEIYWADALRVRCANWGLIPAPLPLGAPTGKGADKASRDFLISYGLEQSPPLYRRNAIAHVAFFATTSSTNAPLVFPHRDRTRLRVSLKRKDTSGVVTTCHSQIKAYPEDTLHGSIRDAQKEVVEKEIFEELIKEASNLPTASTRVSERLIVIDAAQNVELRFELIDKDLIASSNRSTISSNDFAGRALCDLIASTLLVLLLRQHAHAKSTRLGLVPSHVPQILQPIIDLLQYHVFLRRVRDELERSLKRLCAAGVTVNLRFEGVGETGATVVDALAEGREKVGGEASLRIDARHTIRFTFASPSSLTAHLPQATIAIASIPQLAQLLADETERGLLARICELGIEVCHALNGTWFVDEIMCRAVGRWEGCALNFRIRCAADLTLDCHAHQLLRAHPLRPGFVSEASHAQMQLSSLNTVPTGVSQPTLLAYSGRADKSLGLFAWVRRVIEDTLAIG